MSINNTASPPKAGRFFNGWMVTVSVLLVIIITGGVFIWVKHGRGRELEITFEPDSNTYGRISISGEVNNPGLYPIYTGDTILDVLEAAGGLTADADASLLDLKVAGQGETESPQKVNINRAEAWLLSALPGIGEARAQAIIDFRYKFGPFRDIRELLKVPGMGDAIFADIEDLITVTK